uniref:Dolichyl-diphosphooligosaccharide--protein glycosyltransferase subunit 1B n=1 Tax=Tanacetum cinerariifolium TaxID=118510 RepID=A0A6L2L343_TANCI|nr:dolichyl-diphosphooligosaccharide--protein glycosyltransferase subunit 1B [Tanacetum cinerariifolium]
MLEGESKLKLNWKQSKEAPRVGSFGCPIAETVVNKITNKVSLPEGSKNPSVLFLVNRSMKENLACAIEHKCCGIHQPLMNAVKRQWIYCLQLVCRSMDVNRARPNILQSDDF